MKFSIITVTKNSSKTIRDCINSVSGQLYENVEHVIKDALSLDNICQIASDLNPEIVFISTDDSGIYDGMNQGFENSKGDIVAFLNSDDMYFNSEILSKIAFLFESTSCDFVYGDILMVDEKGFVVRKWCPGANLSKSLMAGQIPHPSLFVKRSILSQIPGPFDTSYKIAADLKLQLVLIHKIKARGVYLPEVVAVMSLGGTSTKNFFSYFAGWMESYRAWTEVNGSYAFIFLIRKVASKLRGYKWVGRF